MILNFTERSISKYRIVYCIIVILTLWLAVTEAQTSEALKAVITSNDEFSKHLYGAIASNYQHENLICSPSSVHTVLSMLVFGAHGFTETSQKLRKNLRLPADVRKFTYGLKEYVATLSDVADADLRVADTIFISNKFTIQPNYINNVKTIFNVEPYNIDVSNSVKSAKTINKWVADKTNHKIRELVNSDDINEGTSMVLANAIYFNSNWENSFDPSKTKDQVFYVSDHQKVMVPTMYREGSYVTGDIPCLGAEYVEIPYKNMFMSMIIIMSNGKEHLQSIEKNFVNCQEPYTYAGYDTKVLLHLPKFKVESTIDLSTPLKKVGLSYLFNPMHYDLISKDYISISKVTQKAIIEVSETGSEAAAATGATFSFRSSSDPREIRVNKPFYFLIKYNGIVLFQGHVLNPNN